MVRLTVRSGFRIMPRLEFIAEMLDCRKHRIRRPTAERAQAGRLHRFTEIGEDFQIAESALAALDPFQNLPCPYRADSTRRTFSARLIRGERHEVTSHLDHVSFIVEH